MTSETPEYAIRLDIRRDESQSRLTNFPLWIGTFIRYILLIPHIIILFFYGIVALLLYLIATFAILFSGQYPRGLYDFVVGYMRWSTRVNSYATHLFDKYPPFNADEDAEYPLSFTTDYPAESNRILNFPIFGYYIRLILLIPHFIVIVFLSIAMFIVVFIAQFAILFTGAFPEGMHRFCVGVTRWNTRLSAYLFGLSDRYPPFSTS